MNPMLVMRPAGTALHVKQRPVPRIADPTRDGSERIDFREEEYIGGNIMVTAIDIGPTRLSFNAEHPIVSLPIQSDLTTGRGPVHMIGAAPAWIRLGIAPVLRPPTIADMATDVKPGPVADRRDRSRGSHRGLRRQIGRNRRTGGQGRKYEAGKQDFFMPLPSRPQPPFPGRFTFV